MVMRKATNTRATASFKYIQTTTPNKIFENFLLDVFLPIPHDITSAMIMPLSKLDQQTVKGRLETSYNFNRIRNFLIPATRPYSLQNDMRNISKIESVGFNKNC